MKKDKNYVELIPQVHPKREWKLLEDGKVEVKIENTGFFNRLAQILYKKPRFSYIELDEFGSFVWQQIDGKRDIYEIGQLLEQSHEEASLQLYERLCAYFKILQKNKFIVYQK